MESRHAPDGTNRPDQGIRGRVSGLSVPTVTCARVAGGERGWSLPTPLRERRLMDHIQTLNAASLWDKLTALGYAKGR